MAWQFIFSDDASAYIFFRYLADTWHWLSQYATWIMSHDANHRRKMESQSRYSRCLVLILLSVIVRNTNLLKTHVYTCVQVWQYVTMHAKTNWNQQSVGTVTMISSDTSTYPWWLWEAPQSLKPYNLLGRTGDQTQSMRNTQHKRFEHCMYCVAYSFHDQISYLLCTWTQQWTGFQSDSACNGYRNNLLGDNISRLNVSDINMAYFPTRLDRPSDCKAKLCCNMLIASWLYTNSRVPVSQLDWNYVGGRWPLVQTDSSTVRDTPPGLLSGYDCTHSHKWQHRAWGDILRGECPISYDMLLKWWVLHIGVVPLFDHTDVLYPDCRSATTCTDCNTKSKPRKSCTTRVCDRVISIFFWQTSLSPEGCFKHI